MRVARAKPSNGQREPVEELAEFMNFNLSHQVLYQPQLRGKAATGESGVELITGEESEYRTTPPLSVEQFVEAFRKLTSFKAWSRPFSDLDIAAEACCVQQALYFILHPLVTAKTAHDIALGARRVAEFLNRDSWFECSSSVRDYFGYLSRESFFSEGSSRPDETGWGKWVEEALPPMRWRIEPILENSGKLKGWNVNPYAKAWELYPLVMSLLAQLAIQGYLPELKQCAWKKC